MEECVGIKVKAQKEYPADEAPAGVSLLDSSYSLLVRHYWKLREEVRRDEGRLTELQRVILFLHNSVWK